MVFYASQINLILQIIILILLLLAMREIRIKRRFLGHGRIMAFASVLNIISFLLVMGPSFFGLQSFIFSQPSDSISIITLIHSITGAISMIAGLWLIFVWRLRLSARSCVGKKRSMRITMIFWDIALLSGILIYIMFYIN